MWSVGVYWKFARAGFRRESRYLLAAVAGLLTNSVFGFVKSAVLQGAIDGTSGSNSLAGYTAGTVFAYVWVSQGLLGAVGVFGEAEIGERIKTGDVAVDFLRPVDVLTAHLATDLGRGVFDLAPRGIPSVLLGFAVGMHVSVTPSLFLLGPVSVLLAISVSFLCRYAVNLAGFWLIEVRGVRTLYAVTSAFLSGLFVPVALLPSWLQQVALFTPFPSFLQAPTDVLTGHVTGATALAVVARQAGWVVVLVVAGQLLTVAGRRKLEVQGG